MAQEPDTQPGNYYVSVRRDNGDAVCLAGPFRDDHAAALALVNPAMRLACDLDPRGCWYSYGTVRTTYAYNRPGILNTQLGISGT